MGMTHKKRNVDLSAVKALVTLFGPREAARQAGIPAGTVTRWACQFKWKKAIQTEHPKDAGDVITETVQRSKQLSTAHLAKFTERASAQAAEAKDPLKVAKAARDVSQVYRSLWPVKKDGAELIDATILLGGTVEDAPQNGNLREELSN